MTRIRDTEIEELMSVIQGPDFPTGATIIGRRGIEEAYRTGKGKIIVRAVTNIEPMQNGKNRIVVTELPYGVNKAKLIEKIAELVKDKRVDGITDLADQSSREGMRISIELRRDVNPNVVLNQLMKHTQLQDTFGVIMLALVGGEPRILNIHDMLYYYLQHQEEVVTRRTRYDLSKAQERAHILEGLLIALDHIDRVIEIIRGSANVVAAKASLIEEFGLSDAQSQAIVDMRLRTLTGLERNRLENEYKELEERIAYLQSILGDEKVLLGVIRDELLTIKAKYGDDRKTAIELAEDEFNAEDLIPNEAAVIAMTKLGYIKRMSPDHFKAQNRGRRNNFGQRERRHLVNIGRNIYAHQRTDRSNHFFLIYRLRNRKSNRKQPQNRRSHTTRSRRKLHARNYRRRLRKAGAPRHHRLGIIGQARRAEIIPVGRPTLARPCTRRIRKQLIGSSRRCQSADDTWRKLHHRRE